MDIQHAGAPTSPRVGPARAWARRGSVTQDDIARALGGEILSGVHAPGQALPSEATLLERFGVSRTVLREVLKTLAAKGLVSSRARVGTWVQDSSCWNLLDPSVLAWKADDGPEPHFQRQLIELLQLVAPTAAGLAASRADPAQIAEMRRCLELAQSVGGSRRLQRKAAADFQRLLVRASGNDLMASLSGVLQDAAGLDARGEDHARRERLVDAIEARDRDLAARLALELVTG
jgi:DNA-binding FadR family transcriptional regulator